MHGASYASQDVVKLVHDTEFGCSRLFQLLRSRRLPRLVRAHLMPRRRLHLTATTDIGVPGGDEPVGGQVAPDEGPVPRRQREVFLAHDWYRATHLLHPSGRSVPAPLTQHIPSFCCHTKGNAPWPTTEPTLRAETMELLQTVKRYLFLAWLRLGRAEKVY
jgi:hypothetical protein